MFVAPVRNSEIIQFQNFKPKQRKTQRNTLFKEFDFQLSSVNRFGVKNALEHYDIAEAVFRNNLACSRGIFGKTENIDKLIQNDKIRKNVVIFFNKYAQEQIDELDKKKLLTEEDINKRKDLEQVRAFFSEYEETLKEQEPELFKNTQTKFPTVAFAGRIELEEEKKCKNIVHAFSAACGAISAAMGEGAAVGADTIFLQTTQFLMFANLHNELNVPIIPSLEYYAKELCTGTNLGVGGARLITSWLGLGAHTASALSGSSFVTGGSSDAAITGGIRAVNATLSILITEKMGRGYIRRVKNNRMNFKDQTIETGSYFFGKMIFANRTSLSKILDLNFKDPSSPELIQEAVLKIPMGQHLAINSVVDTLMSDVKSGGSLFLGNYLLTLLVTKEKDPENLKKYAKSLFKQTLIQTAVYDLCDFAVEGQITKEATDTIKEIQEDLEKYPEVFRTFQNAEHEFFEKINLDTLTTDAFTDQFKNRTFVYNLSGTCRQFVREFEEKWVARKRQGQLKELNASRLELLKAMQNGVNPQNLSSEEQKEIDMALQELAKTLLKQQEYFKSQKGFGYERIAGYEQEKEIFTQKFVLPLSLVASDVDAMAPGAILLYGPTGVGKTALTRAIAEQAKCKFLPFKDVDTVEELAQSLEEIKKTADNSNRHTVIKIDEFDDYGADPEAAKLFKWFIQDAPNHNITLFLTTNNPLDIDKDLLKETLNIPINPPDKKNIMAVLKFYAPDLEEHEVEQIADKLDERAGNRAFSNSQIKGLCQMIKTGDTISKQEIMLKLVDKLVPEITKEKLAKFKSEKESLKR